MCWLDLDLPASVSVPIAQAPVMFVAFFAGAILEEVGWTGYYATKPLQIRYGVFSAGLVIGTVWAVWWHVVPWWSQHPTMVWVGAHSGCTIVLRVVMGWAYAYGERVSSSQSQLTH